MNCLSCYHTHYAHELKKSNDLINEDDIKNNLESLLVVGKCLIPGCSCAQYVDRIQKIDEELL